MPDERPAGVRPRGALVLHGFTGTPDSVRPLGDALAAGGFVTALPLLAGHGTMSKDLGATGYADWLESARDAYRDLAARCERVVVAGLSMGGALACELATTEDALAGLVLVNPFLEPPAPAFCQLLEAALASGSSEIPSIGSDIKRQGAREGAATSTPIRSLLSLAVGLEALGTRLGGLSVPILLFSSRVDHVVPPSSGDYLARVVAGPLERVYLEQSYHVATLDNDSPELCRRAVEFAEKVMSA